jgi:hypothetical protein
MRLACLAGLALLAGTGPVSAVEAPRWLTDYDQARAIARREKKPLFVVFRCEH